MASNLKETQNLKTDNSFSNFQFLKNHLEGIDSFIRKQSNEFDPEIIDYIDHIINTSGKKIRPILTLLSGGVTGEISSDHIKVSTILELIHIATLVHDDIIDDAKIRRIAPTANAKWGNSLSVLLGDFLFCHALVLSNEFNDSKISSVISKSARDVCTGEIIQTKKRFDPNITKEIYFNIIEKKTSSLFSSATFLGAYLNSASKEICDCLYEFGKKLGLAYQIYDDCIDLCGEEKEFGKTLKTDINKGKVTLPILYMIENSTLSDQLKIKNSLSNRKSLDIENIFSRDIYGKSISSSILDAKQIISDSKLCISKIEKSDYKNSLFEIANFLNSLLTNIE